MHLTQMIFQVPFGIISDKLGRKGTIIMGLVLFAIGSLICALSTDIYFLLFGRFFKGAGSIGAVVTAMISDLVKEEQRPKAMATMGMFIGVAFAASMISRSYYWFILGVETLFYITMVIFSIRFNFVLIKFVPNPPKITHTYNNKLKWEVFLEM